MTRTRIGLPVIFLAALATLAGCGQTTESGSNTKSSEEERITPEYDQAGKLTKLNFDRNGDGKPDTWGYMDGSRVIRVESDENGDGQIDRWEYHRQDAQPTSASPGPGVVPAAVENSVERVERATRHDGRINRREFFEAGLLVRVEEDTDGNGTVDKWETYEKGALSVMAMDTKGTGKPDRRMIYKPDGSFDRVEVDETGSGTFKPLAK